MQRRAFIKNATMGSAFLSSSSIFVAACQNKSPQEENMTSKSGINISLAQWSLHRQLEANIIKAEDFATISSEKYGIQAVEYVNGFYQAQVLDENFWNGMKKRADSVGVKSLLIMVDKEGDLGNTDDEERQKSVENHYKWVNAAKLLGCKSIRVNAFGEGEKDMVRNALIDGMGKLAVYAARENINILIENHGLFSSDADFIVGIIREINAPNLGTLPDFGNWCLSAQWGSTQVPCDKVYDIYEGVQKFLPYAKGVSAKSYDFNDVGQDTRIDYFKMLKMVKESGYQGYIGIEYEGEKLSEHEGILATKALLEKTWAELLLNPTTNG